MAKDDERAETKENVRARAVARTKASKAMAKTSEDEVAEATKDDLADAGDEAMSKTHHTEAAETREDARIETEQGIKTEIKEDDVAVNIHNFQELGTEPPRRADALAIRARIMSIALTSLVSIGPPSFPTCSLTLVSFQPMRREVHHWQARSLTCSSADCVSPYILPPTFMFALKAPPSSSSRKCLRNVGSLILS